MPDSAEPQPVAADDDTLLEKVDDIVDELLADGIAPPPADPWERRMAMLDSWTAVLLGLAALLTAWVSYQAGNWSDARTDAQSRSAILRNQAAVSASAASRDELLDSQVWLSWSDAINSGDDDQARFLESRFSKSLKSAASDWLEDARLRKDGSIIAAPPGSPMDLPEYVVPERTRANDLTEQSELQLAESDKAATTSNAFLFIAVLLALALFLGSVVTKVGSPKMQVMLLAVTMVLLVISGVRVALLPHLF